MPMSEQTIRRSVLHLFFDALFRPKQGHSRDRETRLSILPRRPKADDAEGWCEYWRIQKQPWRTEPEIDAKRQAELGKCRDIVPDIKHSIYPFKDMQLSRADVEWLLATHEDGRGPVDWSDVSQRERQGLDLRGADLHGVDLSGLPLARILGGLTGGNWTNITLEQRDLAAVHMEGAYLKEVHLEGAILGIAYLERAFLGEAYLYNKSKGNCSEGSPTVLNPADLRGAYFDAATNLEGIKLGDGEYGFVPLADVRWGNVNLTVVNWTKVKMLGDEYLARQV